MYAIIVISGEVTGMRPSSLTQEAEQAKANLHGKKALGQKLVVDWAKPDAAPSKTVSTIIAHTL